MAAGDPQIHERNATDNGFDEVNGASAIRTALDVPSTGDIAGKANLAGGNTFTGDQTVTGTIIATNIGATTEISSAGSLSVGSGFFQVSAVGDVLAKNGTFDGAVNATSFTGDGSALTGITASQVGLGNVDNTSDLNKPVSTATQAAIDELDTEKLAASAKATSAEVITGTDDAKYVTPLGNKAALVAYVQPIAATRSPMDRLYVTSATSSAAHAALGSQSTVAAGPHTVVYSFTTPATAPTSANGTELGGGYSGTLGSANTVNSIALWLDTSMRLQLRFGQSTQYVAKRIDTPLAISTPYTVVWTKSGATVVLWLNGVAQTLTDITANSPTWTWADAGVATYLNGARALDMETGMPVLLNHAWSQTDVDYCAAYTRVPPQDEFAGSMVAKTGAWSSQNANATINSASAPAFDASVTTSPANIIATLAPRLAAGRAVTISGNIIANPGGLTVGFFGQTVQVSVVGTGAFSITTTADTTREFVAFRSANTGSLIVDSIEVVSLGTIAAPEIGWTAQARGRTNGIHATLTPGVTPMPARDAEVQVIEGAISATGYLLGTTGPHVFRDHKVDRVDLMPTTATIPNFTLRRNATSGGTPLINAVSAGTEDTWTSATLNGAVLDGAANDYYHITLSTGAEVKYRIYLSKR